MKRPKRFKRQSDLIKFAVHNAITCYDGKVKTAMQNLLTSAKVKKNKDFLSWAQGLLRGGHE